MNKKWLVALALLLFSLLAVSCGGSAVPQEAPRVEGPALVYFYTDN